MADRLPAICVQVPVLCGLKLSRIRQANKREPPTSGHLISQNPEELRASLADFDTNHVLVLDDTSFSGTTNLLAEQQVRQAFPDRRIDFTHGLLILNAGTLGPNPGARQRIEAAGSRTVGGMEMHTPEDDGWHFFDIVKQRNLAEHLVAVMGLVKDLQHPDGTQQAEDLISDEVAMRQLFPNLLTKEELQMRQKLGHFVASCELNGDIFVRNPQLLTDIVGQGHLLPPEEWRKSEAETIGHLLQLGNLLERRDSHA